MSAAAAHLVQKAGATVIATSAAGTTALTNPKALQLFQQQQRQTTLLKQQQQQQQRRAALQVRAVRLQFYFLHSSNLTCYFTFCSLT